MIATLLDDAERLYAQGRSAAAFVCLFAAVEGAAKQEFPHETSSRVRFERFLGRINWHVERVEYRGELHTIPHVIYKWLRCELVHEGGLPLDLELIDADHLSLRAGGAPTYRLGIFRGCFRWVANALKEWLQTPHDDPCSRV